MNLIETQIWYRFQMKIFKKHSITKSFENLKQKRLLYKHDTKISIPRLSIRILQTKEITKVYERARNIRWEREAQYPRIAELNQKGIIVLFQKGGMWKEQQRPVNDMSGGLQAWVPWKRCWRG